MKKQAYLLLLSSVVFVAVTTLFQVYDNTKLADYRAADSYSYEEAAHFIYHLGGQPHPTRPFLYPLIVGIPYLFSSDYNVFLTFNYAINACFWLLTVLFIYKSLILITQTRYAFTLSLLFACNLSNIFINPQILTESVYTFTLALILFFLTKYFVKHEIRHLTTAIALFVLSILIRPSGLILALLIVPLYLAYLYKKKHIAQIVAVVAVLCLPLLQVVKMGQHNLNFTISNIGNETLYYYLCSYAEGVKKTNYAYSNYALMQSEYEKIRAARGAEMEKMEKMEKEDYWKHIDDMSTQDFRYQLMVNSKGLAFTYTRNLVSNCVAFSNASMNLENPCNKSYFNFIKKMSMYITRIQNTLYSLSILATPFILLYFRKRIQNKSLLYLQISLLTIAIYTILISGISFAQGDRFTIVLVPIALANMALLYSNIKFRKSSTPSV